MPDGYYDVVETLWAALRSLDASRDARKDARPVLRLKQEMLRTIAELNAASPAPTGGKQVTRIKMRLVHPKRDAQETDGAA